MYTWKLVGNILYYFTPTGTMKMERLNRNTISKKWMDKEDRVLFTTVWKNNEVPKALKAVASLI